MEKMKAVDRTTYKMTLIDGFGDTISGFTLISFMGVYILIRTVLPLVERFDAFQIALAFSSIPLFSWYYLKRKFTYPRTGYFQTNKMPSSAKLGVILLFVAEFLLLYIYFTTNPYQDLYVKTISWAPIFIGVGLFFASSIAHIFSGYKIFLLGSILILLLSILFFSFPFSTPSTELKLYYFICGFVEIIIGIAKFNRFRRDFPIIVQEDIVNIE